MSLLAELKRRKVFRVAAVDGATAFVAVQGADLVLRCHAGGRATYRSGGDGRPGGDPRPAPRAPLRGHARFDRVLASLGLARGGVVAALVEP
jgi:hypothetical protein